MEMRSSWFTTISPLLAVLMGLYFSHASASTLAFDQGDIIVIAHPNAPVEKLSTVGLRAIFGMRQRTWPQGDAIKVYVLPDQNPVHDRFAKQLLLTFPYNLRRIWDRRVYSGTGQSPKAVKSQGEMLSIIATTENAIGYIRRDRLNNDVKVVELK